MQVELGADAETGWQVGAGSGAANRHQALGIRKRQRTEQHRVHDAEHPGDRADREREGEDRGDEEPGEWRSARQPYLKSRAAFRMEAKRCPW